MERPIVLWERFKVRVVMFTPCPHPLPLSQRERGEIYGTLTKIQKLKTDN
jgi:hypothetical protein